jgi:ubiquinone/menaquinone biosynthesis C-methylase UbiE
MVVYQLSVESDSPYRNAAAATIYRRVAVPAQFGRPARALVSLLELAAGNVVLDVGSGTGAFAGPASKAVGASGRVVALDRSIEMLQASDTEGQCRLVVGQTPGLPLRDDAFDAVGASFVLPHCRDHAGALSDMARVCRPGGRVGITAWGAKPNPAGQLWAQTAAAFVDDDRTRQAFHGVLPRQEWFSLLDNVKRVFDRAGLTDIHVETREYAVTMLSEDYVAMKVAGTDGAVIRQELNDAAWDDFRRRVAEAFRERFPGLLTYVRDVHFGVATKRVQ